MDANTPSEEWSAKGFVVVEATVMYRDRVFNHRLIATQAAMKTGIGAIEVMADQTKIATIEMLEKTAKEEK